MNATFIFEDEDAKARTIRFSEGSDVAVLMAAKRILWNGEPLDVVAATAFVTTGPSGIGIVSGHFRDKASLLGGDA